MFKQNVHQTDPLPGLVQLLSWNPRIETDSLNHHIIIMLRPNIFVKIKCYQMCTVHKSNSLLRENKKGHVYNVHCIITVS